LPVVSCKEWLNETYWTDEELATPVRNTHKEVFGGPFNPTLQDKEVACKDCGKIDVIACKSWNDYKTKRANWNGFICDGCAAERLKEKQEREIIYLQREENRKNEIVRLQNLPYSEYLLTEHWKQFRQYALKRANFRCQLCNSGSQLNVHHRTYERIGCEDVSDVIVLCKNCHENHHDKIKSNQQMAEDEPPTEKQLSYLKILGYTGAEVQTKKEARLIISELKNLTEAHPL
jgi:hypothetical protein